MPRPHMSPSLAVLFFGVGAVFFITIVGQGVVLALAICRATYYNGCDLPTDPGEDTHKKKGGPLYPSSDWTTPTT